MAVTAAQLMVKVGADISGAQRGMQQVQQQARGLGGALGGIGRIAAGAFAGLGAVALAKGAFSAAKSAVVDFNASMEQSSIAWTTMLGSAQASQKMLADLQQFARTTPFEFPELEQASRRLLAMGFDAKEVIPLMTDLGNAASALGLGSEGVNRIGLALGQMRAKTRVSGEEMRQLTEAGVPAWDILAQAVGKPIPEVMKLAETGKIASSTFIQAFQTFSQQNYGGMMEAQSRTFKGAMSNIKDSLTQGAASAFQPLFAVLSQGAVKLADFLNTPKFEQFTARVRGSMEKVAGFVSKAFEFFVNNSDAIIGGLKGVAAALAVVGATAAVVGAKAAVVGLVTAAFNPLVAIIGAVTLAAGALGAAWATNWGGIRDKTRSVVADVINFWYRLEAEFQNVWSGIKLAFARAWNSIVDKLASGAKAIVGIVEKVSGAFGKKIDTSGITGQIDAIAARARVATGEIEEVKARVFEWRDEVQALGADFDVAASSMNSMGQMGQLVASGSQAASTALDGLGDSASGAANQVSGAATACGDLVAALVRVHPASIAAAQTVATWEANVAGVNAALEANQRRQRDAQAALERTQARITALNQSLTDAKNRLQELANPRLAGMGQFEMKIQAVQDQIKRIQLAKSLGVPLNEIIARYPLLTEGAEAFVATLMPGERSLQKQLEQLQLMQSLEYDEKLRLLKNQASPPGAETTYAAAMASINATRAEIEGLTGAIAAEEARAKRQEQALAKLRGEAERLNQALQGYQAQLQAAQAAQDLVNQGLELAYNWFLNDRAAMLAMGGEAAIQVGIIDVKARELLGAVNTFAGETSEAANTAILGMVETFKTSSAEAVLAVNTELGKIPHDIYTYHHIVRLYETGGTAALTPGAPAARASGGPVYAGQPYVVGEQGPELFVPRLSGQILPNGKSDSAGGGGNIVIEKLVVQGTVISEKELAGAVYDELLRLRRRNGQTGL